MSSPNPALAIETIALTKFYGAQRGCEDVGLVVERGARFGFLGPNGAGKTSTIRVLLSLLRPTSGGAWVLGRDVTRRDPARFERIGFAPAEAELFPELTGAWILDRFARLRRSSPPVLRDTLLDVLALRPADLARRVGGYSTGMKRKLALVLALQHDPELAILDEPTSGLDPVVQRSLLDYLRDLGARGRTVFFSSHNLPEVESVCDRVALVFDGRLVAQESVDELRARSPRRVEVTLRDGAVVGDVHVPGVVVETSTPTRFVARVVGPIGALVRALPIDDVIDVVAAPPSLEDVFFDHYRGTEAAGSVGA